MRHYHFCLTMLLAMLLAPCVPTISNAVEPAKKTVTLIVDYGDGAQKHFTAIPWRQKMTVLDALLAAKDHAHGVRVKYRGSGATAFVEKIDDLDNEGAGRNWLFQVNGEQARKGCGVYPLRAADTVLWKFGKYR